MRVILIGANGFVGSAFSRLLSSISYVELVKVTRENYDSVLNTKGDLVIDASCNSRKFFAEEQPVSEFNTSVHHRLKTLFDFHSPFHLHISSVDVYSGIESVETSCENSFIDLSRISHYGMHKFMAEQLVQHYAKKWMILRFAGMVGPGLRKNPVFDILNNQPLRIHPKSQYQFMHTDDMAKMSWDLIQSDECGIYNIAGSGLISPQEIADMANKPIDLKSIDDRIKPRILNINLEKISKRFDMPDTKVTIKKFMEEQNIK